MSKVSAPPSDGADPRQSSRATSTPLGFAYVGELAMVTRTKCHSSCRSMRRLRCSGGFRRISGIPELCGGSALRNAQAARPSQSHTG
jgi:hypothetical protein